MTHPSAGCFHCDEPLPPGPEITARVAGEQRHFCCYGCRAVSETIVNEGLEQFYQQRSTPTITPQAIDEKVRRDCELFDDETLQAQLVNRREDGTLETWLMVEGITCAACIWLIERHLEKRPGVQSIAINHSTQRAHLVWESSQISLGELLLAIRELGFTASPFQPNEWEAQMKRDQKRAIIRIGIAGVASMQAMMLAYPLQFGLASGTDEAMIQLFRWASWLIATPVVLYSAFPFLQAALRDVRSGHPTMDVPVSLAIYGGYIASAWVTVQGGEEVYFESVCMFTFFLGLGRFLEMRGRYRAGIAGVSLINAVPRTARRRIVGEDREEAVPAASLSAGDQVLVLPGETVPADGTITEGQSALDESMLTGEYLPVNRVPGDPVSAGTVNTEGPLVVRVERAGGDTRVSAIMRLLDRAQQEKPRTAVIADRVASYFVGAVLLASVATFGVWMQIDPSRAFAITLAVLVATCPCALSLATPTALTAATSALQRLGFLPTRGTTLESLSAVDTLVFDKTGTLTDGRLTLAGVTTLGPLDSEACVSLASALEHHSIHPVARAFGTPAHPASSPRHYTGEGITGEVAGQFYAIGTVDFVGRVLGIEPPDSAPGDGTLSIYLAGPEGWLARFALDDQLRPDSVSTLELLKARGYHLVMLSGDRSDQVERVGRHLPLDEWQGALSPEAKLEAIRRLEERGHRVMMVGDGLNDLPVLAGARLSVAMAGSSDIASLRADAVLLGEGLTPMADALTMAPRTRRIIRQNVTLSLMYNGSILPLAMAGLVAPWAAALGMSLSSVVVVMNALRLGGTEPTGTSDLAERGESGRKEHPVASLSG